MRNWISAAAIAAVALSLPAGDLDPPGAPTPTPALEARTAVNTLPGNTLAEHIIAESGSYYLSTSVEGEGTADGILILASDVTLDLNGFSVVNTGSGDFGIRADTGGQANIEVFGGVVEGWQLAGVYLSASNSRIHSLRASDNGSIGIQCGSGGMIQNCVAARSVDFGILAGSGTLVLRCAVTECGSAFSGAGMELGYGSSASDCVARGNLRGGYRLQSGSRLVGCVAEANAGEGVFYSGKCVIVDNVCVGNDRGVDNVSSSTGGTLIRGNSVSGSTLGISSGAGDIVIQNTASNSTTNYGISTSTRGPEITETNVITSTNPWGNLSQ